MFPTIWSMLINLVTYKTQLSQPNIVVIVADDLGWNDVGWNNPRIYTPNMDTLAHQGIILNASYVSSLCSPSRASLLTGYYPFRMGLQHGVFKKLKPHGLPTEFTLLPEKLRDLGYSTHIVGKWHLGFCKWEYTPTYRGFDSFYGSYTGALDYYTHMTEGNGERGYDFRKNKDVFRPKVPRYSTSDYGRHAVQLINNHTQSSPFFLYLPFQGVHTPLKAPAKYERMYSMIKNANRRVFSAKVTALDDAVGDVIRALKKNNMYKKTLILFLSDNGASPYYGGNNWPLRGGKATLWEGGTRVPSFIWGRMLKKAGSIKRNAVDKNIDGINQWPYLQKRSIPSRKREFVYGINPSNGRAAIRIGKYKLIRGSAGLYSGWHYPVYTTKDINKPRRKKDRLGLRQLNTTMLFNVVDDPIESNNLATTYPLIVKKMQKRLAKYAAKVIPAFNPRKLRKGHAKFFNHTWSPGWC